MNITQKLMKGLGYIPEAEYNKVKETSDKDTAYIKRLHDAIYEHSVKMKLLDSKLKIMNGEVPSFVLFCGPDYFFGEEGVYMENFEILEDAIARGKEVFKKAALQFKSFLGIMPPSDQQMQVINWWHVVDIQTMNIVAQSKAGFCSGYKTEIFKAAYYLEIELKHVDVWEGEGKGGYRGELITRGGTKIRLPHIGRYEDAKSIITKLLIDKVKMGENSG